MKTCTDWDDIDDYKIDVILFAANNNCLIQLENFAKSRFHELNDNYKRNIARLPANIKREYENIVADSDIITAHNFTLPEIINVPHDNDGKNYNDHLFVDKITGTPCIKLNIWEEGILREEQKRADFVSWIRNTQRAVWAFCIPYRQENNELHAMFPDFLIVRRVNDEYIVDILEPHDPSRRNNIGKAKGLADYARQNSSIGKIQLIRETNKAGQNYFQRLDFSKGEIRKKFFHASTNNELDNIFEEYNKK